VLAFNEKHKKPFILIPVETLMISQAMYRDDHVCRNCGTSSYSE